METNFVEQVPGVVSLVIGQDNQSIIINANCDCDKGCDCFDTGPGCFDICDTAPN